MFHFCVGDSEEDWRKGSEQWLWLDKCMGGVDRRSQPWLIFMAHRVLGYSSSDEYQVIGTFGEPMGRDNLQELWQKHKVDVAFYGHVHNYERTCPVYEVMNLPIYISTMILSSHNNNNTIFFFHLLLSYISSQKAQLSLDHAQNDAEVECQHHLFWNAVSRILQEPEGHELPPIHEVLEHED